MYSNQQIAEKIADIILQKQTVNTSFSNGTINYENRTFKLPQQNLPKRKTHLINR